MRTERKSNNNIFENNLSNCLITFTLGFHNFGLCLIKPILRFIEKLASYNFCENGTYRAVTLAGHDNALFFWNLRIKKHPQIIHSQNHPQSTHFSHLTKRRSQLSLQFPEKPFQAPKIKFKFLKLIGWRSLSNGHLLKDKRLKCVYPSGHSFYFTAKYEILQLYSNGHSFFTVKYDI